MNECSNCKCSNGNTPPGQVKAKSETENGDKQDGDGEFHYKKFKVEDSRFHIQFPDFTRDLIGNRQ